MREIPLTHGKVAIVDDADYEYLAGYKWRACRYRQKRENWYACRTEKAADGSTINFSIHRTVLNAGMDDVVHHVDDNGLNNVRTNLRLCTHSLNNAAKKFPVPASGYRGVNVMRNRNGSLQYMATCKLANKRIVFGYYRTAIEAAVVRDVEVSRIYGEFAVLNFPMGYGGETPIGWAEPKPKKQKNLFTAQNGETRCIDEWAERAGLSRHTLSRRLKKGWPLDRAISEAGEAPGPKQARAELTKATTEETV